MIAIVRYNAGNICSVSNALRRIGVEPLITDKPEELRAARKVIFPGVGEASSAMNYLRERGLDEVVKNLRQPVLGICVGMQLLCRFSEENDTVCMGVFPVDVRKFHPPVAESTAVNATSGTSDGTPFKSSPKVPHVGWNSLENCSTPLFEGVREGDFVYYVHGYRAEICDDTIAVTDYITPFSAALRRDNFYATQFHPEKSGRVGEAIYRNFLALP